MARKKIFLQEKKNDAQSELTFLIERINTELLPFLTHEGIPHDLTTINTLISSPIGYLEVMDKLKTKKNVFMPRELVEAENAVFLRLSTKLGANTAKITTEIKNIKSKGIQIPQLLMQGDRCFFNADELEKITTEYGEVYLTAEQEDYYYLLADLRDHYIRFRKAENRLGFECFNLHNFVYADNQPTREELFYPRNWIGGSSPTMKRKEVCSED